MSQERVLVTCFDNWHTVFNDRNPCYTVGKKACEDTDAALLHVLPTDYEMIGPALEEAVAVIRPKVVIGLGVYIGARETLTIERLAHNYVWPNTTNEQWPIEEQGPPVRFSTLPNEQIIAELNHVGIPISEETHTDNTPTQQCNMTFYHAARLADTYGFRAGFIHVPGLPEHQIAVEAYGYSPTYGQSLEKLAQGVLMACDISLNDI